MNMSNLKTLKNSTQSEDPFFYVKLNYFGIFFSMFHPHKQKKTNYQKKSMADWEIQEFFL